MQEAFRVLDAIAHGAVKDTADDQPWIDAFQTVCWVIQSGHGPVLTADGRQAYKDLAESQNRPRGSTPA